MSSVSMKMSLLGTWVLILWLSAAAMAFPVIKPRFVTCRSFGFPRCFHIWLACPISCPHTCMLNCVTCTPVCSCNMPGAICEDPRFVGGDGITFYFHGHKDQDFCLVSDPNLHINAHFIGKRNPNLTRDFTWVQSIGVRVGDHKLLVAAKPTSTWDNAIDRLDMSLSGTAISLPVTEGSTWRSQAEPPITITRTTNANRVTVEVANVFRVSVAVVAITAKESRVHGYNITNEDCFAHLELGFKFYNLSDIVDGVLGQTYRSNYVSKTKVNVRMPVMGGTNKFFSSHIFATDCSASRFGSINVVSSSNGASQYPTLQCRSGMGGNGVVCKR
ncbi:BMP-binding endothelial regulator protein [Actinidia chinensis var. chinensis]|uniref:BMP-binding endothelial regulator protein n=1 Tax=Actinidia chinensis var. chinensis TaxID=1590841 RepID=A0A2R6QAR2_ACTCC|nr:BMP-binding endothelial regulator protein [Actinidia chinensis var. chinensis]